MPLVKIEARRSWSTSQKKELYRRIVNNLGKLGILASDVFIVLHEVFLDNWGIRGGVPAS